MKVGTIAARTAAATIPVLVVSALGGYATAPNIPGWYAGLAKPFGTPPNWIFGPVWTLLYVAMAVSIWRVLALTEGTAGRSRGIVLFFVQLALNCLWSFAFFGARNPLLGLVVISALLVAIAATIAAFRPLDRVASLLLTPYLAWVLYATWLNAGVWWLNG